MKPTDQTELAQRARLQARVQGLDQRAARLLAWGRTMSRFPPSLPVRAASETTGDDSWGCISGLRHS